MSDLRKLLTQAEVSVPVRCLRTCLLLLSGPYWIGSQIKNWFFDWGWKQPIASPLPTLSVGNLSVGGTGKSPVVAWLARELRSRGIRVAIISRGYGQLEHGRNDEALELELLLPDVPHLQNPDRLSAAKLAHEELDMQVLILDDGFQHRRISRDLDIVLLDATDPPGAQRVLPRGLYREPFRSIARADLVLLTRADQAEETEVERLSQRVRRWNQDAPIVHACHAPKQVLQFHRSPEAVTTLRDSSVLAFCGIGNPGAFFRNLQGIGAKIIDRRVWPDHHNYGPDEIAELAEWVRMHPGLDAIVCTVKDWVKIQTRAIEALPLKALAIELEIPRDESQVISQLVERAVLSKVTGSASSNDARESLNLH